MLRKPLGQLGPCGPRPGLRGRASSIQNGSGGKAAHALPMRERLDCPSQKASVLAICALGDRADPVMRAYIATPDSRSRTRQAGSKPDTFGADFRLPGPLPSASGPAAPWPDPPSPRALLCMDSASRVAAASRGPAASPAPGHPLRPRHPVCRRHPCTRGHHHRPATLSAWTRHPPPPPSLSAPPRCPRPLAVRPPIVHHLPHWRIIENYIDPYRLSRSGLVL